MESQESFLRRKTGASVGDVRDSLVGRHEECISQVFFLGTLGAETHDHDGLGYGPHPADRTPVDYPGRPRCGLIGREPNRLIQHRSDKIHDQAAS